MNCYARSTSQPWQHHGALQRLFSNASLGLFCLQALPVPLQPCRLADYLGVQLRYPLCLLGSKSSILEGYPPAGTW